MSAENPELENLRKRLADARTNLVGLEKDYAANCADMDAEIWVINGRNIVRALEKQIERHTR